MNTFPILRYRFFYPLQPLSLLTQITSESATGCLQLFSASDSWSIYLEEGRLTYACYLDEMFEPLYRNLQRLSQAPTLPSEINQYLRAIFENCIDENPKTPRPDYVALCWLVNHKYISPEQACILIKELALEVLESFLTLEEGSYEFTRNSFLDTMPKFCHLDVSLLVEQCQKPSQKPENIESASQILGFPVLRETKPKPKTKTEQESPKQININQENNRYQPQKKQHTEKHFYTIVCIDDSQTVLNTIENFLDEQIFSFVGVNDPLKALIKIIRSKPDLILLDIEMPNINGYELCSLLRKHSSLKNTPIIMVTGRTGFIDRAKAKMVRASGYLTKPFTQIDLLKIVFQNLD